MYILLQYMYIPNSDTIIKFNEFKKEAFVYFQSFTAVTLFWLAWYNLRLIQANM